ncbi:hypothetical protein BJ085DRAFT_6160, partial [Dimargaris cristalligena]
QNLTELVVVPGHAVFAGNSHSPTDIHLADAWSLEGFQSARDIVDFLTHIQRGADLMTNTPGALLVFSGGQTKFRAGMRSEAQSYWEIAQGQNWVPPNDMWRATTEEFARDSFENIMFSLCRFYELTAHYPVKITVISYQFKQNRFETLHRTALKIPETKFSYVPLPIENPPDPVKAKGEMNNAFSLFQTDPYGCDGALLEKKGRRNPFHRHHPYRESCPHLRDLFDYCNGPNKTIFSKLLPW